MFVICYSLSFVVIEIFFFLFAEPSSWVSSPARDDGDCLSLG